MNAARQISRRFGRAMGARTRSASFDCIGRTVSFGPDPLEPTLWNRPFSWLSLIIPLSMVLLFLYVPTRRFPGWLVSSALPCYLLHMFFLSVFRIVITTSRNCALVVIGEILVAFMGSVAFSVLIRRVGQPVGRFLFQR